MAPASFPKSLNLDGEHKGKGTSLKPAHEPIVVARKPLIGTVAQNVERFGTGALNIDGCRIDAGGDKLGGGAEKRVAIEGKHEGWARPWMHDENAVEAHAERVRANVDNAEALGRWPANCVLSHLPSEACPECDGAGERQMWTDGPRAGVSCETCGGRGSVGGCERACAPGCPVAELDRQSGESRSSGGRIGNKDGGNIYGGGKGLAGGYESGDPGFGDTGGASRFFYCAKASRAERNAGLDGFEERDGAAIRPRSRRCNVCGTSAKEAGPNGRYPSCEHDDWTYVETDGGRHKGALRNAHPT